MLSAIPNHPYIPTYLMLASSQIFSADTYPTISQAAYLWPQGSTDNSISSQDSKNISDTLYMVKREGGG